VKKSGNTVLITGAGTGIGLEAARQFTAGGSRVLMVARDAARLEQEASKLTGAQAFACDISDQDRVADLLLWVRSAHPDLNLVLLNAAVTHNYQLFGEQDASALAAQEMTTNYVSAVRLTQLLEPVISKNADPAFIVTTSGVALVPDVQNPTYSATKAALHSLCMSMRFVLDRDGSPVQVFEFMAPLTDSPFSEAVTSEAKATPADVVAQMLELLGRDIHEMHVGVVEDLHRTYLRSPQEALAVVNAATGG